MIVSRPGSADLELPDRTGDDREGELFIAQGGASFAAFDGLDMIVTVFVIPDQ